MSTYDILQTHACLGNARRILMKKCFILLVVFSVVLCLSAGVFAQTPRYLLTIENSDVAGIGVLNDSLENIGPDTPIYISLYADGMTDFIGYDVRISLNDALYTPNIEFVQTRTGDDHPLVTPNVFFAPVNRIERTATGSYYIMSGALPDNATGVSISNAFLGRIKLETSSSFSGFDTFTLLQASYVSGDGVSATENVVSDFNVVYLNIVTDVEGEIPGIPNSYTLGQNYPNPFNPTTTIPFEAISSGNAKISVYNVLGQQVAVVADTFFPVGQHTVKFDASNLSSGIYFYKLEMNGFIDMKRLVLLR